MEHSESDITVAILNWNGLKHLQQFLPSVVENSGLAHIRVIDNASTDSSVEWIKKHYPSVELHILDRNHGFTGGYNLGIEQINSVYVVLLNSDVEVRKDWLVPMLQRMNENPRIAACQPKILSWKEPQKFEYAGAAGGFLDEFGYPFCRGRIFETCEIDDGQYNTAMPVFWASGACMMVRRKDFVAAGGLEAQFFAHMEEIDLCWRFWNRGLEVWVEPNSEVLHLGAGTLAKSNPRKTFLNFHNGLAMLFINTSGILSVLIIFIRLLLDGLAGIQFLLKGEMAACMAIIRAHFSFYRGLPYWISRRKMNQKARTSPVPDHVFLKKCLVFQYFLLGKKHFSAFRF